MAAWRMERGGGGGGWQHGQAVKFTIFIRGDRGLFPSKSKNYYRNKIKSLSAKSYRRCSLNAKVQIPVVLSKWSQGYKLLQFPGVS